MERGRGAGFVLLLAVALTAGAPSHGHPIAGGAAALHAADGGHAADFDCARCAGGSAQRPAPAGIAPHAPDCTARLGRARLHTAPPRAALARAAAPRAPPVSG